MLKAAHPHQAGHPKANNAPLYTTGALVVFAWFSIIVHVLDRTLKHGCDLGIYFSYLTILLGGYALLLYVMKRKSAPVKTSALKSVVVACLGIAAAGLLGLFVGLGVGVWRK